MSLIQIWRMVTARRLLIIFCLALGGVAGAIVAQVMPQRYTANSRIMLKVVEPDPITGEAVQSRNLQAYAQTLAQLVHDEGVTADAASKLGWTRDPQLRAAYERRAGDAELSFDQWLGKFVSANIGAQLLANSNIFEIDYTAETASAARDGANAVRSAFIERSAAMRREDAQRNAQWFARQSDELKIRLAAAEKRKADFERQNNIVLQDDNQDTDSAKLKALANTPPPISAPIAAPVVASAPSAGALAAAEAEIANMQSTLGPNHPQMIALQRKRAALAAAVGREQAAARSGGVRQSGPSLESMVNAQTRKVLASRGLVGEAQTLAGEVSVLREQLTKTRQRGADFQLEGQTSQTGMEAIGEAVAPLTPNAPGTPIFIVLGLILGALVGLGLGLGLELLFRRVRGDEDLAFPGIPLLASMASTAEEKLTEESLLSRLGFGSSQKDATA